MKIFQIYFLFIITVFSSCKEDIEIVSAIKETIIPGVPTAKTSIRYVISLKLLNDNNIEIDEIRFSQKETLSFSIVDNNNGKDIMKIEKKGTYKLIVVPDPEKNILPIEKDELHIYYWLNSQKEEIVINTFTEKITRRR